MSFTYTQLKTAIEEYTENNETSFISNLPLFIRLTEERILKNVQLGLFRKNVAGQMTASDKYLAMPSDFLAPFSLAFTDSNSETVFVDYKDPEFIQSYNPNPATTGVSRFYAEFNDSTFIIAPTPATNLDFELHYFYRPTSLTSAGDTGTTWLSTNAPNAMLYGSLVEACTYLKNYEVIPSYEQKFQEALLGLKNLGEGKSTRDRYRYDEIRREPQA